MLVLASDVKDARAFHEHRGTCRVARRLRGDDDARRVVITEVKSISLESTAFKGQVVEMDWRGFNTMGIEYVIIEGFQRFQEDVK